MEFYNTVFFIRENGVLRARVRYAEDDVTYPITVTINSSELSYANPAITFHFASEASYIAFKNSLLNSHEQYYRKKIGKGGEDV